MTGTTAGTASGLASVAEFRVLNGKSCKPVDAGLEQDAWRQLFRVHSRRGREAWSQVVEVTDDAYSRAGNQIHRFLGALTRPLCKLRR